MFAPVLFCAPKPLVSAGSGRASEHNRTRANVGPCHSCHGCLGDTPRGCAAPTLAGLMNSFMISASLGVQYGVPVEVHVSKFAHMRFEPSGDRPAGGDRDPEHRGPGTARRVLQRARGQAGRGAAPVDAAPPGQDGAVQPAGARGRVRSLRRSNDPHRLVLRVRGLRDEHWLLMASGARLSKRRRASKRAGGGA
jgi:hypothetical protein